MSKNRIAIEHARIGFRNFSGKEGKFNAAGKRNFCVFLDPVDAETFKEDGWNIKYLEPRDENEDRVPYLKVAVNFDNVPPQVIMITGRGKTRLDEETVDILDWAEIENVDIVITPYEWEVNGRSGIKAYLKAIYVTLVEDEFESKYANVPDSAANSVPVDD